jgi:NADH-quinone oxidoreductase subunit K
MNLLLAVANREIEIGGYIELSCVLFCIGLFGVLFRRNAIILLMCIELMLNAVNLLFVSLSAYMGDTNGQLMVFFIMVVAAAEAAVGLAILVMYYRNTRTTDVSFLDNLKG